MIDEVKLEDIKDVYDRKTSKETLIPFIGAGFSSSVIPDWNDIISELLKNFNLPENEKKNFIYNPLDAFEYFIWKYVEKEYSRFANATKEEQYVEGKRELLKFIRQQVDIEIKNDFTRNKKYTVKNGKTIYFENHDLLCKKFKDVIYTTNWDRIIEEIGSFSSVSLRKELLNGELNNKAKKVIKFHGCAFKYELPRNDGLIASKTDYYKRMSEINVFDIAFRNDFIQNKFLFVGYSLRDTNVSLMIYQLMRLMSDFPNTYKIIWAVTDYRKDARVFANSNHAIIRPYFLLKPIQENTLLKKENEIMDKCKKKCKLSLFMHTGMDGYSLKYICKEKCSVSTDIDALKVEKNKYIEENIYTLLSNL